MDYVKAIFTNGAVWAALIALANGLVAWLVPDFPPNILALVNALLVVVLGAVGIFATNGVRAQVRFVRAQRAAKAARG